MGIRFPLNVLQVIAVVFASTMCVEAYSQSVNAQTSVCQIMEHPEKKVPRQVEVDADLYNAARNLFGRSTLFKAIATD
jgi:hypothetical protein